MANFEDLKEEAKRLLREGKIKYLIGYATGTNGWQANPVFIKNPEDIDTIVWNPTCIHNLTRFLVDEKRRKAREKEPDNRPVGVVVKGCDSRAIVVLLQEKFIDRQDVFVLGVSCEKAGVIDEAGLKTLNTNATKFAAVPAAIQAVATGQKQIGLLAAFPMMAVASVWLYSRQVLYMPYVGALCLWDLSPLQNQQISGWIMMLAGLPALALALVQLLMWLIKLADGEQGGTPPAVGD